MNDVPTLPGSAWADAVLAASLFAVDPVGLGGVIVRSRAGPIRDRWLAILREKLPSSAAMRKLPLNAPDGRLLGGLDLVATLKAGRPVAERGLLAESDGGVVVIAMAERLSSATIARLGAVLDRGEVMLERDGIALRLPARIGVIALDEGIAADERCDAALFDRLAFHVEIDGVGQRDAVAPACTAPAVAAARIRLPAVLAGDDVHCALCEAALGLGIVSLRATIFALKAARTAAALAGRDAVSRDDATLAARLVLAPRATRLPETSPETEPENTDPTLDAPSEQGASVEGDPEDRDTAGNLERPLGDIVLAAARAAIPADLLAQLQGASARRERSDSKGRTGAPRSSLRSGRPVGATRGEPRAGARLDLVETLRAAAPWQRLRAAEMRAQAGTRAPRVIVRQDDFRITRFKRRTETTTIFVVDASGSSALNRLAEAKGAIELLLADCYVRRDQVALLAFRGPGAELLLPPTRSLVRAKRSLASLPGGGGTPLAAGIDAAISLADAVRRKGQCPTVILMTDGRANSARDGSTNRMRAENDAMTAARQIREAGHLALLVDTSPRPQPQAQRLAQAMGARYVPLPFADATALSRAVKDAIPVE